MAIGGVVINFVAKTADAVSDTNKLSQTIGNLGSKGKEAAGGKGLGGLFKTLAVGIPVLGGVVAGAAMAVESFIDMGKAAYEDAQQARKLETTLSKIPGVTQDMIDANSDWIDSMELATLVSDTDLRAAISKLALSTGDLSEAQRLAALSADVATGANKSFATVTEAVSKAAGGNTASLERMFPWLDKNKNGTLSLKEATEGLETAFGGASEAAADNDPFKRLAAIWGQLKEAIGQALVPLIDRFSAWMKKPENRERINQLTQAVSRLAVSLGEKLAAAFQRFLDWLESPDFKRAVITWKVRFQVMKREVELFISVIVKVIGWIQSLIDWIGRIKMPKLTLSGGGGIKPGEQSVGAQSAGRSGTTAPPPAPTVIVTEEQVYRAVQRLLLRGDARNGRLVMVR